MNEWIEEYITPKNSDQSGHFLGTGPDADFMFPRIEEMNGLSKQKSLRFYTRNCDRDWKVNRKYKVFNNKKIQGKDSKGKSTDICCGVQYRAGCGREAGGLRDSFKIGEEMRDEK